MVKLLLQVAEACVKIHRFLLKSFSIEKRVRKDCLLALYLYLIVLEVLHTMIMKEASLEFIKRIQLPLVSKQQIMAWYANDISLTLFGKEYNICHVIHKLEAFYLGSSLVLNWNKSSE